jgi:hypothetical protein
VAPCGSRGSIFASRSARCTPSTTSVPKVLVATKSYWPISIAAGVMPPSDCAGLLALTPAGASYEGVYVIDNTMPTGETPPRLTASRGRIARHSGFILKVPIVTCTHARAVFFRLAPLDPVPEPATVTTGRSGVDCCGRPLSPARSALGLRGSRSETAKDGGWAYNNPP